MANAASHFFITRGVAAKTDDARTDAGKQFAEHILRMYAGHKPMSAQDVCTLCALATSAGMPGPATWIRLNPNSSSGNFQKHLDVILRDIVPQNFHYVRMPFHRKGEAEGPEQDSDWTCVCKNRAIPMRHWLQLQPLGRDAPLHAIGAAPCMQWHGVGSMGGGAPHARGRGGGHG